MNRDIKSQKLSESLMHLETKVSDCYETQIRTFGSADLAFLGTLIDTHKVKKILDVGCGEGSFILNFAKQFPKVKIHAVENVPSLIAACLDHQKRVGVSNVHFEQTLFDEGFSGSNYDMMTARFAVEHMQNLKGFVSCAKRALRQNGVMAITEYCVLTDGIQSLLWREFRTRELKLYKHINSHAQVSFDIPYQLEVAGFQKISSRFIQISPATVAPGDFFDLVDAYAKIYSELDPENWTSEFVNDVLKWSQAERRQRTCDPAMWLTQTSAEREN